MCLNKLEYNGVFYNSYVHALVCVDQFSSYVCIYLSSVLVCSHECFLLHLLVKFKASIDTEVSMCIHFFDNLFSLQLIHSSYSVMYNNLILMHSMDKSILCNDATCKNNSFLILVIILRKYWICTYLQFPATQLDISQSFLFNNDLHLEFELGIHSQVSCLCVKFGLHLLVQLHLHVFGLYCLPLGQGRMPLHLHSQLVVSKY